MTSARPDLETPEQSRRGPLSELAAPRRVFKRKRRNGLILMLKIALPLIALSCVGYIYYWWRQAPVIHPTEVLSDAKQQASSDVKLQKVQYNGVDANNRPFSITADHASQPQKAETAPPPQSGAAAGDASIVNLEKLMADMTMGDGAWVAVTADNGVYHRDAGTVDLSGNVTLFHDTGLSFETDAATVDLKNDWARGDQPVEGQNADGQLASQGFEVRDGGQTIVFTGRAYLKLFPKKSNGGGS
ncbi:LPS export ABC transporter periplasmic protein LptC [Dongia sedimenti]|uniref:LPS export ABC transporter periplasmic protein LptC n=1 Tax=Dongia sedimenti TaxID=3064282 RepID=A0ABU0YLW1_9PROT|nr:LPS export ABC transporter periplasmic protein LptC [Rhodospirillaceae bacterium R-7]